MNIVKIGTGIGQIKFGMERNQIKMILGEPNEKELFSFDEQEEDLTEVWHYDEHEFSLSFDETDDWKLVMIAASAEDLKINGEEVIGFEAEKIQDKLGALGLTNLQEDQLDEEGMVWKFDEQSLNIWFEDKVASEIQWSPLWSDEDTPIFPSLN